MQAEDSRVERDEGQEGGEKIELERNVRKGKGWQGGREDGREGWRMVGREGRREEGRKKREKLLVCRVRNREEQQNLLQTSLDDSVVNEAVRIQNMVKRMGIKYIYNSHSSSLLSIFLSLSLFLSLSFPLSLALLLIFPPYLCIYVCMDVCLTRCLPF